MVTEKTFPLYGKTVTFTEQQMLYYELKDGFTPLAQKQYRWYMTAFDNYGSKLEQYISECDTLFNRALQPVCEWGIKSLSSHGNYDYTVASLTKKLYEEVKDGFEEIKDHLEEVGSALDEEAAERANYREVRKKYRDKAYGSYHYNLIRRAASSAAAGAANLASGTAHSVANAIGNAGDKLQVLDQKGEQMKKVRPMVQEIVMAAISDVLVLVCESLEAEEPVLSDVEEARLENLSMMPKEVAEKEAFYLLGEDPGEQRIYEYFLKTHKDPNGELDSIAKHFFVDLSKQRKNLLDAVYKTLSSETLEQARTSIEIYKNELAQYGQTEDDNLKLLLAAEKKLFDEARTFHGTLYDTIEERQMAEKRFEQEKENIDALSPQIDAEIDKLTLMYTPESFEAAKTVHDALEKRYAGLARTAKMLQLKQYLYVYSQSEKAVEAAEKSKASKMKLAVAAVLCGILIVWNVLVPLGTLMRWGLAIASGIFLWIQLHGLMLKKQGGHARMLLESGGMFQQRDTLEYIGKENYSLEHKENAPDPKTKQEKAFVTLAVAASIVLIGFVSPLLSNFWASLGREDNAVPDEPAFSAQPDNSFSPIDNNDSYGQQEEISSNAWSESADLNSQSAETGIAILDVGPCPTEDISIYTTGYVLMAMDGSSPWYEMMILFADESVTVWDFMNKACSSCVWEEPSDVSNEAAAMDLVGTIAGKNGAVRLRFSYLDGMYKISEGWFIEENGTEYSMAQSDIANTIYMLNESYHADFGDAPVSKARQLRGTWSDEQGTELTITGVLYDVNDYAIVGYDNIQECLQLSITRSNGRIDGRYAKLLDDGQTLTLYEDAGTTGIGVEVGTFTRIE